MISSLNSEVVNRVEDTFEFSGDFGDMFGNLVVFQISLMDYLDAEVNKIGFSVSAENEGQDFEATLYITLEEAFNGIDKEVLIEGKKLKIKIDPGTQNGKRLRLKRQGGQSSSGGERGDLYLTIKIEKHPFYEIEGYNLYYDLYIDFILPHLAVRRK